jgi:hypothetical protein
VSERRLRLASAGFAAIGTAITAYLLYVRETGGSILAALALLRLRHGQDVRTRP